MKITLNYLFVILLLLLVCCGRNINNIRTGDKMKYDDFIDGQFTGVSAEKIKSMLGAPNIVKEAKGSEVWHYSTGLKEIVESKDGAIIGLTVYFDEHGKVREITASRKNK